jgi:hypothetical protein
MARCSGRLVLPICICGQVAPLGERESPSECEPAGSEVLPAREGGSPCHRSDQKRTRPQARRGRRGSRSRRKRPRAGSSHRCVDPAPSRVRERVRSRVPANRSSRSVCGSVETSARCGVRTSADSRSNRARPHRSDPKPLSPTGGHNYTAGEYRSWLRDAGFDQIEVIPFEGPARTASSSDTSRSQGTERPCAWPCVPKARFA